MNDFYGKKFLLINGIEKGNKPRIDFFVIFCICDSNFIFSVGVKDNFNQKT